MILITNILTMKVLNSRDNPTVNDEACFTDDGFR